MGLVDDDRVVGAQLAIGVRFGEQYAVGHHLEDRVRACRVLEADLVADEALGRLGQFVREAVGETAGGDAPRLRAADEPRGAAPERQADLRDLRGLARARLAADDGDGVVANESRDLVAVLRDGEVLGKARLGKAGETRGAASARSLEEIGQQRALALDGPALSRAAIDRRGERRDLRMIGGERAGEDF